MTSPETRQRPLGEADKTSGGPTAAVIAYHNPQILVNVVDLNEQRVRAWNSAHLPIHEDGLLKVVRIARDGTLDAAVSLSGLAQPVQLKGREPNLVFSTNVVQAIAEADIVFICVNTPTKMHGVGAGSMADVSAVEGATRTVAQHARPGTIIVEKSTVPCGTARMIQDIVSLFLFPVGRGVGSMLTQRSSATTVPILASRSCQIPSFWLKALL
jgi:UDPglucose 6-dehydrogenase